MGLKEEQKLLLDNSNNIIKYKKLIILIYFMNCIFHLIVLKSQIIMKLYKQKFVNANSGQMKLDVIIYHIFMAPIIIIQHVFLIICQKFSLRLLLP